MQSRRKRKPKAKKQALSPPQPAQPKTVRFSDPWERKWMSGPLGAGAGKEQP